MYITYDKFDFAWFKKIELQRRKAGNQSSKQKFYYKDIITAFDIETTYIKEIDQSVMYIWQWQFGPNCSVIGRTWHELIVFIDELVHVLGEKNRLIVFVHNLSFEFQFLSGVFDFNTDDVFCIDKRKILKALLKDCIEFRCSYLQTNMSLRAFCEKMGVKNFKLKMNYNKRRYWYTELTQKEMAYCLNDVRGLVEAIQKEMDRDGDNLYTLPLTSTGYARRDAKKAMKACAHDYIPSIAPDMEIYKLCREAFRGGNTHASRYYSGKILHGVMSADRASAYPDAICNELFPVSRFFIHKETTLEKLDELMNKRGKAVLIRCSLTNLRLKNDLVTVPYLPVSKCFGTINPLIDNGRIISADYVAQLTITDIDYKIICSQYDFDMEILTLVSARYGMLPAPLRECVMSYFRAKTDLKDKETDKEHSAAFYKLLYDKSKNLLNAQYGMMAQDPVKITIQYLNKPEALYEEDPEAIPQDLLEAYNKRAFVVYQWACWVTSWARYRLQEGIDACGIGFVYCDTDSCKYLDPVDWEKLNEPIKRRAKKNGTFATDPNGKDHFMGVFELEETMSEYKTMGAKKYAFRDEKGKLHITIAGVNKRIGAIELERAGGIKAMKPGFVFKYAGGLEARYNDFPDIREWKNEDGVTIMIRRNVSLVPNTKTLGITAEYRQLLETVQENMVDL